MSEEEFYNHLNLVSERISKEVSRARVRWFLEKEGFSAWEIDQIEVPINFRKRKVEKMREKLKRIKSKKR